VDTKSLAQPRTNEQELLAAAAAAMRLGCFRTGKPTRPRRCSTLGSVRSCGSCATRPELRWTSATKLPTGPGYPSTRGPGPTD
jgi:hypothetical protein